MIKEYYNHRAKEYEEIYHRNDPVRQEEQSAIVSAIKESFVNRHVLEIACGTGYWTKIVADVASSVTAIDISQEMLAIAKQKSLPFNKVKFYEGDAYCLKSIPGKFNAGLANFWFSHVPKAGINGFLQGFHKTLGRGTVVFMADNIYVPGVGGELIKKDNIEDTFKLRILSNGLQYEVLKNYYNTRQLYSIFTFNEAINLQIHEDKNFWWLTYKIK